MKYGSICSGIEAASVAWHPLGWEPRFFSEINTFASSVLKARYPVVPNYGDMTNYQEWPNDQIDLLVGGTPCQSFSAAGLRQGMDDPRGRLALIYLRVLEKYRPRGIVWENVPGVLTTNGGRDFGSFLWGLGQLGYRYAYRVLDAQYFGVPQRRRRVFVVGHLGDWRRPAAVLFERGSVRGDSPKSRAKGETTAGNSQSRPFTVRRIAPCLTSTYGKQPDNSDTALGPNLVVQSVSLRGREGGATAELGGGIATALRASQGGGDKAYVLTDRVRRLTPIECERLQGLPDNWTMVSDKTKDGPRYKAIGNSMAVPVMRWIGARIAVVDAIPRK